MTRNAGEELDAISRDLDRTGRDWVASVEAGNPPYEGPEYEAREAVFRRLRAWNERQTRRMRPTPVRITCEDGTVVEGTMSADRAVVYPLVQR